MDIVSAFPLPPNDYIKAVYNASQNNQSIEPPAIPSKDQLLICFGNVLPHDPTELVSLESQGIPLLRPDTNNTNTLVDDLAWIKSKMLSSFLQMHTCIAGLDMQGARKESAMLRNLLINAYHRISQERLTQGKEELQDWLQQGKANAKLKILLKEQCRATEKRMNGMQSELSSVQERMRDIGQSVIDMGTNLSSYDRS